MTGVWNSIGLRFGKMRSWAEKKPNLGKFLHISSEITLFLACIFVLALDVIYPLNLVLIAIVALFSLETVIIIALYGKIVFDKYVALLFLLLLAEFVANLFNGIFGWTQNGLLMIALSLVIYEYCRQYEHEGKRALTIFALASWVFAALFLWQYWRDMIHPDFSNRLGGFFGNENDVARHAAFSVIFNLLFAYNAKNIKLQFGKDEKRRFNLKIPTIIIGSLASLYFYYVVLLTGSVSNFLAVSLIIVIFFAYMMWKKSRILCVSVLAGGILLFFIVLQLPSMEYFRDRLLDMLGTFSSSNSGYDSSTAARFHGAIYGLALWSQRLIFGTGGNAGIFQYFDVMAHNNISQTASWYGLFGLVFEEMIIFYPLIKSRGKDVNILLLIVYIIVFQFLLVSINSKTENMVIPICVSLLPEASVKFKKNEIVKTKEAVI